MRPIEKYQYHLSFSKEDGGVIGTIRALPGCSAFGETLDEARAELNDAAEAWLGACAAAGNPIPVPDNIIFVKVFDQGGIGFTYEQKSAGFYSISSSKWP